MIVLENKVGAKIDLPCLKSVSIGRAYELLRDDVRAYLVKARREIGFEYCRFHALFHDDMDVVYEMPDGKIGYHWHHIDKIYDFLLSIGMRPFVELNPMPALLASGGKTMFWYKMNITPPKDMKEWYNLIYSFVEHVADRYGNEEVSKWFFEVWNEPNLDCFWAGTKKEYFELYRNAAMAVKAVSKDFKVGGPATAVADWIEDIINYCSANNVPLDFISTHAYPHDEYCRYGSRENSPHELGQFYIDTVKGVKEAVGRSMMADLKIYWTEFNTLSTDSAENITFLGNPCLDSLYSASCIVRNMAEVKDYCDMISYWVVSDIFEEDKMPHLPFSGTYGLLTIRGIKKAAYNAFVLLKKIRGNEIKADFDAPLGCGMLAAEENGVLRMILWNNQLPEIKNQPVWQDVIKLNLDNPENYIIEQARIRKEQGSPYESWLKMGKPANLTTFEEEFLHGCSEMEYSMQKIDAENNTAMFSLAADEVLYMEIRERDADTAIKAINYELDEKLKTY